jgi:hypothetical protein
VVCDIYDKDTPSQEMGEDAKRQNSSPDLEYKRANTIYRSRNYFDTARNIVWHASD